MSAHPESAPEPLEAWHRRHGASWAEAAGARVVESYGDVRSELAALERACGVCDRRWVEVFELQGEDRLRFLNGYVTCDVSGLTPGAGVYGFFTDAQGRILADAAIAASAETLRVAVPAGRVGPLIEHLSRYVLADRVEIVPRSDLRQLLVAGPGAEDLLADLSERGLPDTWSSVPARLSARDVEIQRERELSAPVFIVRTSLEDAAAVADELVSRGAVPAGFEALEGRRILAGVPRYGAEFDGTRFPQETGLEDAISYTKGCYLGQEVVARIHYRGHVNYELRALRGDGKRPPAAGAVVELAGREVGRLGSVALSAATGEAVALAILHRKAATPGTEVSVSGGLTMRVEAAGSSGASAV